MKSLPKEKRDQLVMVALMTLAACAGIWYGLILNQKKSITRMAVRFADEESRVNGAERLVKTLPVLQRNLTEAEDELAAGEVKMASGDMYSWVIFTINKFKEGRRIDIPQFGREVRCDVGMLTDFPFGAASFTLRGTAFFHDLGRFIADFENSFPYARIQNLDIEPVGNSTAAHNDSPERLNFKFEIVTLVNAHAH